MNSQDAAPAIVIFAIILSGAFANAAAPGRGKSCLDRFSEELPKATEWVLMPLETTVPPAIRETIGALDSALRSEAAATPQAGNETYSYAVGICETLTAVLNERDSALAQNRNMKAGRRIISEAAKKAWFDRSWLVGPSVENFYAQLRESMRKGAPPARPPQQDHASDFQFPELPEKPSPDAREITPPETQGAGAPPPGTPMTPPQMMPPQAPAQSPGAPSFAPMTPPGQPPNVAPGGAPTPAASSKKLGTSSGLDMNNGGLNRGAYDQRQIWSSRSNSGKSPFYYPGLYPNYVTPLPTPVQRYQVNRVPVVREPRVIPQVTVPRVATKYVTINGVVKQKRVWTSPFGVYYYWTYSY